MKKGCLEAQLVPLPRGPRQPAFPRLLLFERVIAVLVTVRDREEFRGQEGVADREEEDQGCYEIERLSRYSACEPLPQIRNPLIAIAVGGSRESGLIRTGRGCRRVARAGKKSAEQNQAENQFPADLHGMAVWRLIVKIRDARNRTVVNALWPAICKPENHHI